MLSLLLAIALDWNNPQSIVDAAISASPLIREADANLAAARARQQSAGALPNPMLMGGQRDNAVMLGASQTLVRRDRRDSLERSAAFDVQRLEAETQSRRAEVGRDALVAYYDAAAAQNEIDASEEVAKLAGTIADAARIRYETGGGPQADIIRAALEQSTVTHEVLMQRSAREQALARLRALLGVDEPLTSAPRTLSPLGDEGVLEERVSGTPATQALEAEIARAEEEIRLAKLAKKPNIDIEGAYGYRPGDGQMVTLLGRIELPVRRVTDPRIAEAIAKRDAAKAQLDSLKQRLALQLGVAIAERNEAIEQVKLHVETLMPQAKLGFESSLASYQSGRAGFDSVLLALQAYRALDRDYYDYVRRELVAQAEIDAIHGGAQ
jgi:outer membrane protein TolC